MSDFDKLRTELKEQGFIVEKTNRGHWKATQPNRGNWQVARNGTGTVTFSESNDPRAIKNTISDLRKIGFEWPPTNKKNGNGRSEDELGYEMGPCPHCHMQTFNLRAGACENMGCPTRAPQDTDALYAEVKAVKELMATAQDEFKKKQEACERAAVELQDAKAQYDDFKRTHERLKQQLIKALEE